MPPHPKILKKLDELRADQLKDQAPSLPVKLTGTARQIKWALSIREEALGLRWPERERSMLSRVHDATWFIANREALPLLKFKEPSPEQICSLEAMAAPGDAGASLGQTRQPEKPTSPAAPLSKPSADYIDGMTPLTGAPVSAPPRSETVQKPHDLEDRVSDAERWAESVSHTPKLAESAILAVLSRLYKDPMKSRLRTLAYQKMGEAQCAIEKDVDAIKRMLV